MPAKQNIYGWDGFNWVAIKVDATGRLIIDPSAIFEDPPTNGETEKAANSNWSYDHWKDPIAHGSHGARVYNSANVLIGHLGAQALPFDSERYDTDTIHSTVANTSRLTCKTAGKYLIVGGAGWEANLAGDRFLYIVLNGVTALAYFSSPVRTDGGCQATVTTIYDLAVADFVELWVNQSSGGNLNVLAVGNWSPEFMMQKIG